MNCKMCKNLRSLMPLIVFSMIICFSWETLARPKANSIAYYVASDADGSGDGSIRSPFSSLEQARDALRCLKEDGELEASVTIYLRGGDYFINDSFKLDQRDSGSSDYRVTYCAYNDEKVRFIGGVSIPLSEFEEVTDKSILDRLPDESSGKVLKVNLKKRGITDYGKMSLYGHSMGFLNAVTKFKSGAASSQLFYNDESMQIARWPNDDFAKIDEVVQAGSVPRHWMDDMKGSDNKSVLATYIQPEDREDPPLGFKIKISDDRIKRWTKAEDIWMFGYWYWDWSDQSVEVESIDFENNIISSVQPSAYGVREKQRFYVYNLLEEIDMPGEWYLDRQTGDLYFYPPADASGGDVKLSLLDKPMIEMKDVHNVTVKGIDISVSRSSAFVIKDGGNCLVSDCMVSKVGGTAISTSGGKAHGVKNCVVFDVAASGISVSGGDRHTLSPAGHYVENCHIHSFGRMAKTYNPAISISGVGNRAVHNEIHNGPHAGLIFGGNDHIIAYNEIYDVVNESQDMGAIYCGRDLTGRGNVIKHNFIHDVKGVEGGHPNLIHGIYFDDMYSGCYVIGNVFSNMPTGVLVNGGRDHTIDNNIFVNISNKPVILATSGFMSWSAKHWKNHAYGLNSDPRRADVESQGGSAVPWDRAPYDKYPHMTNIREDEPKHPKYNSVAKNVFYNSPDMYIWIRGEIDFGEEMVRGYSNIRDNFLAQNDPGFEDAEDMAFSLKSDSVVYQKISGFEPIPFDTIGPVTK
ncbi:MAG: right-handed parallel beta-helix repeat-containing protein [Sedimentisphaeraceae bacterium JB056]